MPRWYSKDNQTGNMIPLGVKVEDTLPVGTEIDYDGQDIPEGWVEVDDPNVYSTSETRIGTWLGKPLYRKVLSDTLPDVTTTGTTATKNVDIGSNIDLAFVSGGYIHSRYGLNFQSTYFSNDGTAINCYITSDKKLRLSSNNDNYNGSTANIIVHYTKTTD
jgi:hypothetical protein